MSILNRSCPGVFLACLMTACAGADHAMPVVSEEERAEAVQDIRSAPDLSPTTRTVKENERIARHVMRNLQAVAGPVCRASDWGQCWYTLEFSRSGGLDASILKNHIVLADGLARYLTTEDEFAAVLAHEMGHDIAGHYEKSVWNRSVGGLLSSVIYATAATAAGQNRYQTQSGMATAYTVGEDLGDLSFSKEHEREADYIGAYIMTRAGYNPEKGKGLWVTLAKHGGSLKSGLFDTHPGSPERLAAWETTIEEVRYSKDLIPNLAGAEEEQPLQVARVFDGSPVNSQPEGSAVALATRVSAVALATRASAGSYGTAGYEAGLTGAGLGLTAPARKRPANAAWSAWGARDSCGAEWALELQTQGSKLRGNMWWQGVKYDVYGNIDHKGRTLDARAGKSKESQTMAAPRFFRLDLALDPGPARGSFAIDSASAACRAEFALTLTSG